MPETGSVERDGASSRSKKADDVAQHDFVNPTLNIINGMSPRTSTSGISSPSREGTPPPLPPRPQLGFLSSQPPTSHSIRKAPSRPQLVSKATTQLSLGNGPAFGTESRDDAPASDAAKQRSCLGVGKPSRASEADDNASVVSYMTRAEGVGEGESMSGEAMGREEKTATEKTLLKSLGPNFTDSGAQSLFPPDAQFDAAFNREFDEIEDMHVDGSNQGLTYTTCLEVACADVVSRSCHAPVACEIEAFPDLIECRQAHLQ